MTIMEPDKAAEENKAEARAGAEAPKEESKAENPQREQEDSDAGSMFSEKNIHEDSDLKVDDKPKKDLDLGPMQRKVTITPADKVAFIDAVVNNTRYTRD